MLAQYIPVLITFALALIVVTVMVNVNRFLSPRNKTPTKPMNKRAATGGPP